MPPVSAPKASRGSSACSPRSWTIEYLQVVEGQLKELGFRRGTLISAGLGRGNKGAGYVLRKPREQGWRDRIPIGNRQGYSFSIPDRDENGHRALSDLRARGLNASANALAQSNDHILAFFTMLRAELAFYIGCLNLREALAGAGEPLCVPVPLPQDKLALTARGLYDPVTEPQAQRPGGRQRRGRGRQVAWS